MATTVSIARIWTGATATAGRVTTGTTGTTTIVPSS